VPGRDLILLGAGGHASVVAESAAAAGWRIVGYCADAPTREVACAALSTTWLGPVAAPHPEFEEAIAAGARIHAAVGDARLRERWLGTLGSRHGTERLATIIHPGAWTSPSASIAPGSYVGAFAAVNATASIGLGTIVNTGAIAEHGAKVGLYAHLAPRSILAGLAEVGDRAFVGAGAIVLPFVRVGADAVVGAGAVVRTHVEAGQTVVGVPAAPIASRTAPAQAATG
jgi:sugar O-acyltransferase (sialic acid O-acetyltransferase NeuD family)